MIMKRILLLLFSIPLFISCGPEVTEKFNDDVKTFSKSEGIISLKELMLLEQFINQNSNEPDFERFLSGGKADKNKLVSYLQKEKKYKVEKPYNPKTDAVNIYIENSLSMHGYIDNNGSGFKNAIAQIFSVSEKFKNYNPYYINSDTIPANLTPENIVNISKAAFTRGNVNSSNLDDIFKTVLSKTGKDDISILVSDCIYSLDKGDATDLLKRQALLTQRTFENAIQKNKSVTTFILKLESDFTGSYYDRRDHAYANVNLRRPFYVIIIGNDEAIKYFKSKTDFTTLDGYKNFCVINSENYSGGIYHTVVNKKNTNSTFRPIDEFSDDKGIKGIEDISVDEGEFTFTVALDLSEIPVEESYLEDKSNYSITDGDYVINDIVHYNPKNIEPRDANIIKQSGSLPTHLITFKATSNNYNGLRFTLNRNTPKWVTDTNISDDTDITKIAGKTFGFSYLVNSIKKAYTVQKGITPYIEISIAIIN